MLALAWMLAAALAPAAPASPLPYETLFYKSDGLALEAYLYRRSLQR
jgi:hypothetical protein